MEEEFLSTAQRQTKVTLKEGEIGSEIVCHKPKTVIFLINLQESDQSLRTFLKNVIIIERLDLLPPCTTNLDGFDD